MDKNNDLTLENIGILFDQKLTENNKVIFAEMDTKLDDLRDAIQNYIDDLHSHTAKRVEKLEKHVFAS